jgi:hypothetical protein
MAFNLTDASGNSVWSAITLGPADLAKIEFVLEQLTHFLKNISILGNGQYTWGKDIIPKDSQGNAFIEENHNANLEKILQKFCENLGIEALNELSILVRDGDKDTYDKEFCIYGDNVQYNIVDAIEEIILWLSEESLSLGEIIGSESSETSVESLPESSYIGQLLTKITSVIERLDKFKNVAKDVDSDGYWNVEETIQSLEARISIVEETTVTHRGFLDVILGGNTETDALIQNFLEHSTDRWEALNSFLNENNATLLDAKYVNSNSFVGKLLQKINNNNQSISANRDALSVAFSVVNDAIDSSTAFPKTTGAVLNGVVDDMTSLGDVASVCKILNNLLYYARASLMLCAGESDKAEVLNANNNTPTVWEYNGSGVFTLTNKPSTLSITIDGVAKNGVVEGQNFLFDSNIKISYTGNLRGVLYKK